MIIKLKRVIVFALAATMAGAAAAQGPAPETKGPAVPSVVRKISLDILKGTWIRPDGGYRIVVSNVGPNGQLEAMYFNPTELPFAKAQATLVGGSLRAAFELRAGGYNGSTYDLTYDPASDQLKGIYYQAVMKQKFDVYFVRK
jgi:hypothetical protein